MQSDFCGCCGRPGARGLWCQDCEQHLASSLRPPHERTYYAQHGEDCPLQVKPKRKRGDETMTLSERLRKHADRVYIAGYVAEAGLMREAADALDRQTWRPMESAPMDGTSVLLLHPGSSSTVGWFTAGKWRDESSLKLEPTHWMPIPAPPETPQETK